MKQATEYWVRRLVRWNLVDRAYYGTQVGKVFVDDASVLRHFLSSRVELAYGFHPLIEPGWIRARTSRRRAPSVGPIFRDRHPVFVAGRLMWGGGVRALARFLKSATASSIVPTSGPVPVTLGEALASMWALTTEFVSQDSNSQRRNSTTWDADAEEVYRAGIRFDTPALGRPLVSIVMPTFNRRDVIGAAIASVVSQTVESWELVIIDDGSSDDTASLVEGWIEREPRIRFLRQGNLGVSAARNAGIAVAVGDLIAFLDTDNTWMPDYLRASLAALDGSPAAMSHTVVRVEQERSIEYVGRRTTREELLQGRNVIDLNALIVRRSLLIEIGGFDANLSRWVDYDLVLRLLSRAEAVFVPMLGVAYDHRSEGRARITTTESDLWRGEVLDKNMGHWESATLPSARIPGRLSVLVRTHRQWPLTLDLLTRILRDASGEDLEIVVIDNASPRDESAILVGSFLSYAQVTVQRVAVDLGVAVSTNFAFALSTGMTIMVLEPDAELPAGWIEMVRTISADGVVTGTRPKAVGALVIAHAEAFSLCRGLDPLFDIPGRVSARSNRRAQQP